MAKFEITGLDKLQKRLKHMEQAARELDGTHEIPLSELLTPSFMRKYTRFSTFDELMNAGGFKAETTEEFKSIPEGPFDAHIAATTKFRSWKDMIQTATNQYISKKLGF